MLRIFVQNLRDQCRLSSGDSATVTTIRGIKAFKRVKPRNESYVTPNHPKLVVLGSGANGAPSSVCFEAHGNRMLFNCGEGLTRVCKQLGVTHRFDHVFLTQSNWQCIGGLFGMAISMYQKGTRGITVHSPQSVENLFETVRTSVMMNTRFHVSTPVCEVGGSFETSDLRVDYLPICGGDSQPSVMSYSCVLKPKEGAFDLQACVAKNITPGPWLLELSKGRDVTLPNGEVVKANEVCSGGTTARSFLVVDVPSSEYLPGLKESEILRKNATDTKVVVHFSPQNVIEHPEYQQFIHSFPAGTEHLVVNENNRFSGFVTAHEMQWKLNLLDEQVFPLLRESIDEDQLTNEILAGKYEKTAKFIKSPIEFPQGINWTNAEPKTTVELKQTPTIHRGDTILRPQSVLQMCNYLSGFNDSLKELKAAQSRPSKIGSEEYPKIVFFGTGSTSASLTRNGSAILVHTTSETCILLDCAEGTAGQITRFYGNQAPEVFRKLQAIHISHRHADHHLGVIGILEARRRYSDETQTPLHIFGTSVIEPYLDAYQHLTNPDGEPNYFLVNGRALNLNPLTPELSKKFGLIAMQTAPVKHCFESFGVALIVKRSNSEDPIKITYSGDCIPCPELVRLGADSTILIHEATFEDELAEKAAQKYHSTVSQAIDQGQRMNAKHIILTHFSQRYSVIPRISGPLPANVSIAFDNMQLVESDLQEMHQIYPTMQRLFVDDLTELDDVSNRRNRKKNATAAALLSLVDDNFR